MRHREGGVIVCLYLLFQLFSYSYDFNYFTLLGVFVSLHDVYFVLF